MTTMLRLYRKPIEEGQHVKQLSISMTVTGLLYIHMHDQAVMSLPSLHDLASSQQSLEELLSLLFEPSPAIKQLLVPSLSARLDEMPRSYAQIVDLSQQEIATWSDRDKAGFIAGHPRIGEVSNLSKLSAREQASEATPPEVLARLKSLNALYESCYPGLRYITHVAGRSRTQVADDMEQFLMEQGTAGQKDEEGASAPPTATHPTGSPEWKSELERALGDIYLIARARLQGMGAQ